MRLKNALVWGAWAVSALVAGLMVLLFIWAVRLDARAEHSVLDGRGLRSIQEGNR